MESILRHVKQSNNVPSGLIAFDENIIEAINTSIFDLEEIGVKCYISKITGLNETWEDLLGPEYPKQGLEAVKTYISLKAKLIWDPSNNSGVNEHIQKQIDRIEWRLNWVHDAVEKKEVFD